MLRSNRESCYAAEMRYALALLLSLPGLALADETPTDCACINRDGSETPLGQIACLSVGGETFLARCAMSQNVLTWRRVQDGCLSSQARPISVPDTLPRS
ncbi:hypothetical protein [Sagittula stellata]|uniref:Uncharacterized protein n=2 Tax=Sagittula stellata TaxID=52603 RepID=A3JXF6_SAGS3|nr:hypothetical protein [Sagittula stellata]EBA10192.1 hypothetical protein SSE37_19342 [Sagittula stellata E-37]